VFQVQQALRMYSSGEYTATKQKFDQVNWGRSMGKMAKLLKKQDHKTWNLIFAQVSHIANDVKKWVKKARGVPQASAENGDGSDSDVEIYSS